MTSSWPGVVSTGAQNYGIEALTGWSKNFEGFHEDFHPWIENGGGGINAESGIQTLREQVRRGIWTIGNSHVAGVNLFAKDEELIQAELKKVDDRDEKLTVSVKLVSKQPGFVYCSPKKKDGHHVTDGVDFIMYGKGRDAQLQLNELKFKGIKESKDGRQVFASISEVEFIMHVESGEEAIREALPDMATTVTIAIRCNPTDAYLEFPDDAASDDALGITWPFDQSISDRTFNPISGTMISTVNLGTVRTIGDFFQATTGVTKISATSSAQSTEQQCPKQACPTGQKCCASVEISTESASVSKCPDDCSNGVDKCATDCLCMGKPCPGTVVHETLASEEATPQKTCCADKTCDLCDLSDPAKKIYCGWLSVADQQPIDSNMCLGTPDELPLTTRACKPNCDLATEVELTESSAFRFLKKSRDRLRSPTRKHAGLTQNKLG